MHYWSSLTPQEKAGKQHLRNTYESWSKLRGCEKDKWGVILNREIQRIPEKHKRKLVYKIVEKPVHIQTMRARKKPVMLNPRTETYLRSLIKKRLGEKADYVDVNSLIDRRLSYRENRKIIESRIHPTMQQAQGIYLLPTPLNEEIIREKFKEANLPIVKIKKTSDGFYVYHPYGTEDKYKKYTVVERGEGYVKKQREQIKINRDFIEDEDILDMIIAEAKHRRG